MKIILNVNRVLAKDILEVFTWHPFTRYSIDTKRSLPHKINKEINKLAIHKQGFKLKDIQYEDKKIIYTYHYKEQQCELSESSIIEYHPVFGEKQCKNCISQKLYKGQTYCMTKGIKTKKTTGYKCLYWQELETTGGTQNLHKQRRSSRYDKANGRIHNTLRRRRTK